MKKSNFEQVVDELNQILDSMNQNSKTETLAFQRGYLTGWLARLAATDSMVRLEIREKLKNLDEQ